jgi:TonB-linked SusC/RagA family outer membrane protein
MKITAVILLSACLAASAHGLGQQITLSEKDAPLQQVFEKIEKQSGYTFAYAISQLSTAKKVTVEIVKGTLEEALQLCFRNQSFTYKIIEKTIVVSPMPATNLSAANPPEPEPAPLPPVVHGRVTNEKGEPVAGVNISIKGGPNGSGGTSKVIGVTNENGEFTLRNVAANAVLVFSAVNTETLEIKLNGRTELAASVKTKMSVLDEVQIIAYGATSKRLQTGNVSSVKAEDIEKQPVNNPLLALQGRVPGIFITQSTGFAGSGVKVRIQGENSINNGNDPLYVVDGVPYVSQLLPSLNSITGTSGGRLVGQGSQTFGSPLNYINPSDIESIEVLKDADATAIYGSQAANGAVLITTKKGKQGDQRVEFNIQSGFGKVTRKMDLLNTRQYLDMRYEALKNDHIPLSSLDKNSNFDLTVWDTTRFTDWQKVLIGNTAYYTDVQSKISGGNINTYYSIGGGYHRETTVLPGDFNDQKASMHFQISSTSSNQRFRVELTGNYMYDVNQLPNTLSEDLTAYAMQLAPNAPPLYNNDGTLNWALNPAGKSTWRYPGNPLAGLLDRYIGKTNNLVSNIQLNYKLIDGLNIRSSFGYSMLRTDETAIFPLTAIWPQDRAASTNGAWYGDNSVNSWIIEPQLNYERKISKGKLEALAGYTIQQKNSNAQRMAGASYISDAVLDDINAASSLKTLLNLKFTYKYCAAFARLTYNWENKYIVNLTGRRDGSSRFGEENQFHNFGSAGAAWIFSEEKFIKKNFSLLSFGKLKASYGTTGSDQIGDYRYLSTYSPVGSSSPYQGITTLRSNGLSNPYLQWEETSKLSVGMDLGFLEDRILLNGNYYRNRSSNELLDYRLPLTTGFSGITKNFPATVQNAGIEISITTVNVQTKKLSWSTTINFTNSENKLISFPNIENSSYGSYLIVGEPISIQKKFHFIGVDQNTGLYYFNSKSNPFNPKTPDDANVIINTYPKFYGGFQNSFSYKGFQFDILFQFAKQTGRNYSFGFLPGSSGINQPTYILNRWQLPGDISTHQRFNSDYGLATAFYNASSNSDAAFADASYIRLKNVSLSYRLSEKWIRKMHIQAFKIYAHAQNLLTFTKYKGLDPETMSVSTLPTLRVVTAGVQITL